ncbi:MBL fold metallo-hydrolase [uncultured Eudoraea sp.]|uniref:MBL fold metallo-hydrolase RNA specificity domain-containing protein n=1 Tax=uncultured Eudoraea sp. TaxID=1035614 RepID=UPI0026354F27|nr:MBL fold metallo-hydrolase [uncultured Eudoraea sp.]
MVKVHFLGASGTVTGSKFCIETDEPNILIDCGMFQGRKDLRKSNWEPLPFSADSIDVVLLTHGHLDHTGYLPRLVINGFNGKIIGTAPTLAITKIILLDSAKINEEEAELANKEGYSKHRPALPLYNIKDAENAIALFRPEELNQWTQLTENIRYRFRYNGHIIGSTFIEIEISGKRFIFSGDVGRPNDILLDPPVKPEWADFLFIESTYGNKLHPQDNVEDRLVALVNKTLYERGNLLIPSFAVERLQSLMYLFWKLYRKNKIPNIPIFIDSPMGNNVLSIFERFPNWHKLSPKEYKAMCAHVNIIDSYRQTWETIDDPRPKIVIAGSGMVSGGRILTYLQQLVDNPNTNVLLVGYMAEGTRGRALLEGAQELKIFGKYYAVKASIHHEESLSAHADQKELIDWMDSIKNIPERVFLIHGEQEALLEFKIKISDVYKWHVHIPEIFETVELIF